MNDIYVHICFVKSLLKNVATHGLSPHEILVRHRLSPQLLEVSNARIPAAQFAELQRNVMIAMNDEMLGYLNQPVKVGTWTVMVNWLSETSHLSQAIKRCSRFYALIERGFRIETTRSNGYLRITFDPWNNAQNVEPYAYELAMFTLHRLLCWLGNEMLPIRETGLPYLQTDNSHEYKALLYGSPVRYNQAHGYFLLDLAILDKPVKRSKDELNRFLSDPLQWMLVNNYNNSSWSNRIKQVIGSDISYLPTFEKIAGELAMHPKKLSRLLQAEGISYKELKNELRRDTAIFLLAKKGASVSEVAIKTGFSESRSFIRAFKSWTGATPYTYRKYMQG